MLVKINNRLLSWKKQVEIHFPSSVCHYCLLRLHFAFQYDQLETGYWTECVWLKKEHIKISFSYGHESLIKTKFSDSKCSVSLHSALQRVLTANRASSSTGSSFGNQSLRLSTPSHRAPRITSKGRRCCSFSSTRNDYAIPS